MIETILKAFAAISILGVIFALLPTTPALPNDAISAIQMVVLQARSWGNVLPVADIFTIISLIFTIEAIVFVFHSYTWVFNKFFGSKLYVD